MTDQEVRDAYEELILCVWNKYPGETRHETAKRYLLEAETPELTGKCTEYYSAEKAD